MTLSSKDSSELQALERRVRECQNAQKLAEFTVPSLAGWDELQLTLESLKDYFDIFPIELKTKLTYVRVIRRMEALKEVEWQDDSDDHELHLRGSELIDSLMPHLGSDSWDPLDASYAGLLGQTFLALEGNVKELENGNAEDDTAIKKAAAECLEALKVPGSVRIFLAVAVFQQMVESSAILLIYTYLL